MVNHNNFVNSISSLSKYIYNQSHFFYELAHNGQLATWTNNLLMNNYV